MHEPAVRHCRSVVDENVTLVTFVMVLTAATATRAVGVLDFLVNAGKQNGQYFREAKDKYQRVVHLVAAPTVAASAAGVRRDCRPVAQHGEALADGLTRLAIRGLRLDAVS